MRLLDWYDTALNVGYVLLNFRIEHKTESRMGIFRSFSVILCDQWYATASYSVHSSRPL